MKHTPRLAHCVWTLSPLQGATPVGRQSRFHGVSGKNHARGRSLGGIAFCFVSPARCAGSSFTYAERYAAQAPGGRA